MNQANTPLSISDLTSAIKKYRWLLVVILVTGVITSLYLAITTQNIYTSFTIAEISSTQNQGSTLDQISKKIGFSSPLGQLFNDTSSTQAEKIEKTLVSRKFALELANDKNWHKDLLATKSWSSNSQKTEYDKTKYDPLQKRWLPPLDNDEIRSWYTYKAYLKSYSHEKAGSNIYKINFEHSSAQFSQAALLSIIDKINTDCRNKAKRETNNNIEYIEQQLSKTNINEIKTALYKLLEQQLKEAMLLNSDNELCLTVIDPPFLPYEKSFPNRAAIVALGAALTAIIILLFVLITSIYSWETKQE